MAQGGGKKKGGSGGGGKKQSSKGSQRKKTGHTSKNLRAVKQDYLRDKTGKSFIGAIETEMATRVPSDQRAKLTLLKTSGGPIVKNRSGKKKPLTRGRKRKDVHRPKGTK